MLTNEIINHMDVESLSKKLRQKGCSIDAAD